MSAFNFTEISNQLKENPKSTKSIYLKYKTEIDEIYSNIENKSEKLYLIKVGMLSPEKCLCGKSKKFHRFSNGYHSTCGDSECKKKSKLENTKNTNLKKWGVECVLSNSEIREKIKKTNKERTGYECNLSDPKNREKSKKTMEARYGVDSPLKSPDLIHKRRLTMERNYGTHSWLYSNKWKDSMLDAYGVINPMEIPEIKDKVRITQIENKLDELKKKIEKTNKTFIRSFEDRIELSCNECENRYSINKNVLNSYLRSEVDCCPKCNFSNRFRSNGEREIYEFCLNNFKNLSVVTNKKFGKYEVDVYIEELKIGIEFNGLYWHSEEHKTKGYHIEKSSYLESLGINLIHVWEDDWNLKRSIIKSIIKSKIDPARIGARKLQVRVVNYSDAKSFHETHHLDGYAISSFHVGLYLDNEIISLASFGRPRFKKYAEWELVRYTTKENYSVIGGFSKILKKFQEEKNPVNLITYKKLDMGTSNIYEGMNFQKIKRIGPNYFWIVDGVKMNRMNFMKSKIPVENNQTEVEYMHDKGYFRIWDSGSDLFMKNF